MGGEFRYNKILHSIQSIDFTIGAFFYGIDLSLSHV